MGTFDTTCCRVIDSLLLFAYVGPGNDRAPDQVIEGSSGGRGAGQLPFAASTIWVNVPASRTARSARILRSISMFAVLRPFTNLL
jgi:hypothetical protein